MSWKETLRRGKGREIMTKSRPIIFNAEMIRAILADKKTQTRRVIDQKVALHAKYIIYERDKYTFYNDEGLPNYYRQCPYGKRDDYLWVREAIIRKSFGLQPFDGVTYAADLTAVLGEGPLGSYCDRAILDWNWKRNYLPSIFMPKWASRITLKIIDIRIERVQDITFDDVVTEGIPQFTGARGVLSDDPPDPRWKFIELWDSINAKRGYTWESNPRVWVISFERIDEPEG